jgi:hypothetical protein
MMVGRERRSVEVGYVGYKVEMNLVDRYAMADHSKEGVREAYTRNLDPYRTDRTTHEDQR